MNFLALDPRAVAVLLATLSAVVVLLYLVRTRRRRVRVPYSPLWQQVIERHQATSPLRVLKRLLSLLAQLLVLAALILALADPEAPGLFGCAPDPSHVPSPRQVLLVVDTSASMLATDVPGGRIVEATHNASRVIEQLNPGDLLMLAEWDRDVRPLTPFTTDKNLLLQQLKAVRARDVAGRTEVLLPFIESTLAGRPQSAAVLVSDLAFDPLPAQAMLSSHLTVVPIGTGGDNVGFVRFNLRPQPDDSLNYSLQYRAVNHSQATVVGTVFLYAAADGLDRQDFVRDDRMVGSFALTLLGGQTVDGRTGGIRFPGSRVAARFEPAGPNPLIDIFPRDDVAFAVVPERKPLRVLLVSERNLFLYAALMLRENVALTQVAPAAYHEHPGYDLTVFDAFVPPTLPSGPALFIHPSGPAFPVTGTRQQPLVKTLDRNHPLARGLELVDLNIARLDVLQLQPQDQVVARAGDGTPVIVTRLTPGGKWVLLPFDLRESDLPLRYAFPILIVNTLNWIADEQNDLRPTAASGAPLEQPIPWYGQHQVALRGPGGLQTTVSVQGGRAQWLPTEQGIYELHPVVPAGHDEPELETVAVMLTDGAEGAVNPRPAGYTVYHAPPAPPARVVPWWQQALWRGLLALAWAILAVEWLTFHRRWSV